MKPAHQFLLLAAAAALSALALGAVVNLAVDPYGIFGAREIEGFNALKPGIGSRARLTKTVRVASEPWEALIVGTSRAEIGFDPGHASRKRCVSRASRGRP